MKCIYLHQIFLFLVKNTQKTYKIIKGIYLSLKYKIMFQKRYFMIHKLNFGVAYHLKLLYRIS